MDKQLAAALGRFRVEEGAGFALKDRGTDDLGGLDIAKADAPGLLKQAVQRISAQQDMLYAQDRSALLCIFQAMDAAGKDGAIKYVFSGVNPQGCHVASFKAPTTTELDQDFLRRHVVALPPRGTIGIHNRSWYEEVLVARVHPAIVQRQRLPNRVVDAAFWEQRLQDIAGFERYLARQGVVVLKFFLHVSKAEQKQRFLARIDEPEKNWKFNAGDVAERQHWDAYQDAYERAIRGTATAAAPWYVVPADRKWFTRLVVANAVVAALDGLDLAYPAIAPDARQALDQARAELQA